MSGEAILFVVGWGAVAFLRVPTLERRPARTAFALALASALAGVLAAALASIAPNLLDVSPIYVLIVGLLVLAAWAVAGGFLYGEERAALFASGLPFGLAVIPSLYSYSGWALWRFLAGAAVLAFLTGWCVGSLRRDIRLRRVAAAWAGVPAELVALAMIALAASCL